MSDLHVDYWYWWVFACIFLILEALLPGVIFVWLAISSVVLGVLAMFLPDIPLSMQLFLFSLIAMSSALISGIVLRKRRAYKLSLDSDDPGSQYIGRTLTLSEPIMDGRSKVRVDDITWKILGPECPAGTRVKVVAVEGILLRVELLKEP